MPPRSAVDTLPKEIKEWLDSALAENGFGNYRLLAKELQDRGYEISKSAIHRYGQKFEDRLASLKMVTEQSRAIVMANPDDDNAINEALMRLSQEKAFELLLELKADPSKINIAALIRSVAELGRASVVQKKYAEEVRERERERAAELAEKMGRAQGMAEKDVKFWREKFLGVK